MALIAFARGGIRARHGSTCAYDYGRLRPRYGSGVRACLRPAPVFNTAPSRLLRADEGPGL